MPGGMMGAVTCGIFPLLLLCLAMVESGNETVLGMNGLVFGVLIMLAGFALYASTRKFRKRLPSEVTTAEVAEPA